MGLFCVILKIQFIFLYISSEFIVQGANTQVNIDGKTLAVTMEAMEKPDRFTFDAAQNHVFSLMERDSYPRFLRSDIYKGLLSNATSSSPKKKYAFESKF